MDSVHVALIQRPRARGSSGRASHSMDQPRRGTKAGTSWENDHMTTNATFWSSCEDVERKSSYQIRVQANPTISPVHQVQPSMIHLPAVRAGQGDSVTDRKTRYVRDGISAAIRCE
jgi:hypothetical protein